MFPAHVNDSKVFRSMLGFAFPLFGQQVPSYLSSRSKSWHLNGLVQMFNTLGIGGGNSLLGGNLVTRSDHALS